ncbi:MAG: polysaccharide deacetylase family protein [Caldilineaceae bacterium]|nr:polysaccharide deacetylase family protein [Caldilineaceae bacterium]
MDQTIKTPRQWKGRNASILLLLLLFTSIGIGGAALWTYANSRTTQWFGALVHRVDRPEKVIALTFDDGPTQYWPEIQAVLAEKQVKATFYLVGGEIEKEQEVARQIVAAGHQVGNHSYSHPRFLLRTYGFVQAEIEKTNSLLRDIGYQGEITFRPPYGKKLFSLPLYLSQHDIVTVTWDVEPDTYLPRNASPQEISTYIKAQVQPGSIILLHPWYGASNNTRAAIGLIIDELHQAGYQFARVDELLNRAEKPR